MKKTNKVVSTMVTLSMLAGLLIPAGSAFAATDNRVNLVPAVDQDWNAPLTNQLALEEDSDYPTDMRAGTVEFVLPAGAKWTSATTVSGDVYGATNYTLLNDQVLSVEIDGSKLTTTGKDGIFLNPAIEIDGFEGDLKVEVNGYETGITEGEYLIARVVDGDTITTAMDVETIGETGPTGAIKIEESAIGSMGQNTQTVKVKVPADWSVTAAAISFTGGFNGITTVTNSAPPATVAENAAYYTMNDRDLEITFNPANTRGARGIIYITPTISADDADYGDVEVAVSGTNVDDADVVVAKYADFGTTTTVDEVEDVIAGKFGEETGIITLEEDVEGTFIKGRKINVELPSWVKITDVIETSGFGSDFSFVAPDGTDNEIEITVDNTPSGTNELEFGFEVSVEGNKTGDIEAKITSKSGLDETIVIAKVVAPATAVASEVKDVKIGVQAQAVADVIITEGKDEVFTKGEQIKLELPDGVYFDAKPTFEVIEGNLELDEESVDLDADDSVCYVTVDSESSKASKIKVSNIKITATRNVPEGAVTLKIGGAAIIENSKSNVGYLNGAILTGSAAGTSSSLDEGEFDTGNAAKVTIAKVVTPAPEAGTAVFNIGSTVYTVGNVTKVMDAAPYIKNSRTYVPVRYLAYALGVSEDNVQYENGVVTLINGDTTVKLTIGSTALAVNDATVTMDVAPEVVNGRTMLPARFVAEALGAAVGFANGQVVISK